MSMRTALMPAAVLLTIAGCDASWLEPAPRRGSSAGAATATCIWQSPSTRFVNYSDGDAQPNGVVFQEIEAALRIEGSTGSTPSVGRPSGPGWVTNTST